jgi:hypothetical protein
LRVVAKSSDATAATCGAACDEPLRRTKRPLFPDLSAEGTNIKLRAEMCGGHHSGGIRAGVFQCYHRHYVRLPQACRISSQ